MPYTEEQLEGLTDEERDALTLDDEEEQNGDDTGAADAGADAQDGEAGADAGADVDDGADAGEDDAAATAAAADAAAQAAAAAATADAAAQPKDPAPPAAAAAPSAPLLIVQAPADADAKLAEIAGRKEDLAQKFDDGDITAKEFQKQLDAANKEELNITLQVREANLTQQMEDQRVQNQWVADCNAFVAAHPEYADKEGRAFQVLNETIMAIARMPSNASLSNEKALAKAHRMVLVELGEDAPAAAAAPAAKPAPQQKIPRPAAPPNIANLPAAAIPDTSGGEFKHLERLQSTNPDGYEEALLKLSPAQRDRWLRA